jgi:hypothetical protein
MDEVGGKRYTELKKEISGLQKELKRHERPASEHKQEMKELGLVVSGISLSWYML